MHLSDDVLVICKKCNKLIRFQKKQFFIHNELSSLKRGELTITFGTHYYIYTFHSCSHCQALIFFEFNAYRYLLPEYNSVNHTITNAELVNIVELTDDVYNEYENADVSKDYDAELINVDDLIDAIYHDNENTDVSEDYNEYEEYDDFDDYDEYDEDDDSYHYDDFDEDKIYENYLLKNFLEERQIDTLLHFTRAENLVNIFQYGLLPHKTLLENGINCFINDYQRLDRCDNANCLSLEFPNYKMFYRLRCNNPSYEWVVLAFKIDVLYDFECAYCRTNASNSDMRTTSLSEQMGFDAFTKLYEHHEGTDFIRTYHLKPWYPTNPQAEVLVFGNIPTTYISTVYFDAESTYQKYKHLIPNHIPVQINSRYFDKRSDWKYWRYRK